MSHTTNREVFWIVNRGGEVSGYSRNFWGRQGGTFTRANDGYIPKRVGRNLDAVAARRGGIEAIIYSYATPIAVRIDGVWLIPHVSYSATTGKHQSHLSGEWIPWDASEDEIESIIDGYIRYDWYRQKYHKGHNEREV